MKTDVRNILVTCILVIGMNLVGLFVYRERTMLTAYDLIQAEFREALVPDETEESFLDHVEEEDSAPAVSVQAVQAASDTPTATNPAPTTTTTTPTTIAVPSTVDSQALAAQGQARQAADAAALAQLLQEQAQQVAAAQAKMIADQAAALAAAQQARQQATAKPSRQTRAS